MIPLFSNRRIWLITAAALLVIALSVVGWGWTLWTAPGPRSGTTSEAMVRIPAGAGPAAIADSLMAHGLLQHRRIFLLGCRMHGLDRRLKAGRYLLPYGISARDLAGRIVKGRSELLRLTIPEGLSAEEVAARLADAFPWSARDFLRAAEHEVEKAMMQAGWLPGDLTPQALVSLLDSESNLCVHSIAEGYLYPETYHWDEGALAQEVASTAVAACLDSLAGIVATIHPDPRSASLTPHEILVLSSIVEAETPSRAEMPRVAAVYLNRLMRGKNLEADPTVAHALGKKGERILYRDLESESLYNTYRRAGLPPGPIGAPGAAAVRAVLNPDPDPDLLYFVADGRGGHVFSATWAEHEEAVRAYRERRRSGGGS